MFLTRALDRAYSAEEGIKGSQNTKVDFVLEKQVRQGRSFFYDIKSFVCRKEKEKPFPSKNLLKIYVLLKKVHIEPKSYFLSLH